MTIVVRSRSEPTPLVASVDLRYTPEEAQKHVLDALVRLAAIPNLAGAIVGRALYSGAVDLRRALAEGDPVLQGFPALPDAPPHLAGLGALEVGAERDVAVRAE